MRYVIYNTVSTSNLDAPEFANVRVSRVAEFTVGSGDVSFEMWIDSTTLTVWWDYDFDGAGKTFISCSMEGVDFIN